MRNPYALYVIRIIWWRSAKSWELYKSPLSFSLSWYFLPTTSQNIHIRATSLLAYTYIPYIMAGCDCKDCCSGNCNGGCNCSCCGVSFSITSRGGRPLSGLPFDGSYGGPEDSFERRIPEARWSKMNLRVDYILNRTQYIISITGISLPFWCLQWNLEGSISLPLIELS